MDGNKINEISAKLCDEIALVTGVDKSEINADQSLSDNGVNSLGFVELLLAVEHEFGVKLMDNGLSRDNIASVHALAEKIIQLL